MDVHVDHAGEQRLAGQVDMLDVLAPANRPRVGDRGDAALVVDEDRRMFDIFAGQHVEIAVGGDTVAAWADDAKRAAISPAASLFNLTCNSPNLHECSH